MPGDIREWTRAGPDSRLVVDLQGQREVWEDMVIWGQGTQGSGCQTEELRVHPGGHEELGEGLD